MSLISRLTESGKALWNALPGVDRRLKVGGRKALIDEL